MIGELQRRVRNAQGQLVETTVPVSQLAGEQGLTAPPTTPIGVANIGGTPKQQDMAGSQGQKANALRQSTSRGSTLQEAIADKRYDTAAAPTELIEKQKKLSEALGDTGTKVRSLLDAEIAKLNAANVQATLTVPSTDPTQQNAYSAVLGAVGSPDYVPRNAYTAVEATINSPEFQTKLNELATLTGKDPLALAAEIDAEALKQGKATAGKAVASVLADRITINDVLPQLTTNATELSQLLGIPEAELGKMSMSQLSTAVEQLAAQSTELTAQETRQQADSALLGTAEKAAFREAGKELAVSGQASTEAALDSLSTDLGKSDIITFGGKSGRWEELLSDESISNLISDYLLNPDSVESRKFATDPRNKQMLDFVNKHREAFTSMATKFREGATENVAIQEHNRKLAEPLPGVILDNTLMQEMIPGWDPNKRSTTKYTPTGFLAVLQDTSIPEVDRRAMATQLSAFKADHPGTDIIKLDKMDSSTAKALFTRDVNGIVPMETLKSALDYKKEVETGTIDQVISSLFDGAIARASDAQARVDEDQRRTRIGLPPLHSILDSNNDGKLDDIQQLRRWALNRITNVDSMPEAIEGKSMNEAPSSVSQPLTDAHTYIYDLMKQQGLSGSSGIEKLVKQTTDINTLQKLVDANLSGSARAKLPDITELNKLIDERKVAVDSIAAKNTTLAGKINYNYPGNARIAELAEKYGIEGTEMPVQDTSGSTNKSRSNTQEAKDKIEEVTKLEPHVYTTGATPKAVKPIADKLTAGSKKAGGALSKTSKNLRKLPYPGK